VYTPAIRGESTDVFRGAHLARNHAASYLGSSVPHTLVRPRIVCELQPEVFVVPGWKIQKL
jgi:hypothetical protein